MKNIIKRIRNFDSKDKEHCWWLFKNMLKNFFLFEIEDALDSFYWLKIYIFYDSKRKKNGNK